MIEESTTLEIPKDEEIQIEKKYDEKTQRIIREVLIESATRIVENSILKKYITKEQIRKNIEAHTKTISNHEYFTSEAGIPRFKDSSTIFLHDYFFSTPVLNYKNLNSELYKYPEMLKILEITGLTIAIHQLDYEKMNPPERKPIFKYLLANYFVSEYEQTEIKEIILNGKKFKSNSSINSLTINYIKVLSYIIGEDKLIEAMLSKKPKHILISELEKKGTPHDIASELIYNIQAFPYHCNNLIREEKRNDFDKTLYNKIYPLYDFINRSIFHNDLDRKKLAEYIKKIDYDRNILFKDKDNEDMQPVPWFINLLKSCQSLNLTKEEKEYIERCEFSFYVMWNNFVSGDLSKEKYLVYYKNEPIPKQIYLNELQYFHWLNKTLTIMKLDEKHLNEAINRVNEKNSNITNALINIIIYASKNNKLNLTTEQFEDILSLITFDNFDLELTKKQEKGLQKTKNKIKRQEKK